MLPFAAVRLEDSLKNHSADGAREESDQRNGFPRHLYISPTLYATPEQSPIPDHPSEGPTFFSPYVVNYKRRRGRNEAGSAGEVTDLTSEGECSSEEVVGSDFGNGSLNGNGDGNGYDYDDHDAGFPDTRGEATWFGSEVGTNHLATASDMENCSLVSDQGDFFDAIDDFSSAASISSLPSCSSAVESELQAVKISIIEETKRRKAAEETLVLMRNQWEWISSHMSEAGLTFPAPSVGDNMQLVEDSIEQLLLEVVVCRFVAEAVGRNQGHAEAEEAAAMIVESKDQEMARLRDRLQYYETVNYEMSQRKLVEVAQRQQQRKKSRQRWVRGLMGLAVSVGALCLAYSYVPSTRRFLSLTEPGDSD